MISIIISTYQPEYFESISANIADTIGVPYEIVAIENKGQMGICEAYNRGVNEAKYPFVCLVHEDINIRTNNWGLILLEMFNKHPDVGLIGVAGSDYKPLSPSHWSFPEAPPEQFFMNIIHGYKNEGHLIYKNPRNENFSVVAAIDGVFMASRKDILLAIPFDQSTFTHFHGYDADISIAVGREYNIGVTFEILIEHISEGNFNRKWIEEILKLHNKWQNLLPINKAVLTKGKQVQIESAAMFSFMNKMKKFNFSLNEILGLFKFQNSNFKFPVLVRLRIVIKILLIKFFSFK